MNDYSEMQRQTLQGLKESDDVTEVRILKTIQGVVSGYFDDEDALIRSVQPFVGKQDVYITLNPVKSSLLERRQNLLEKATETTKDQDIAYLRYVLVDIDPQRESGLSSTDAEKAEAYHVVKSVVQLLKDEKFPKPIMADSGNGYHLLIPIHLSNTEENIATIKSFLSALNFLVSNEKAEVDLTTYNPSRIVKFYGTIACKGSNTEKRPHRLSSILFQPKERTKATLEQIKAIADKEPKINARRSSNFETKSVDIEDIIQQHKLDLAYRAPYGKNATKYIFQTCPWNQEHTDRAAYIIQFDDGGIAAGCHHNGCSNEDWASLKQVLGIPTNSKHVAKEKKEEPDIIHTLIENVECFEGDDQELYVRVKVQNHYEVMAIGSSRLESYVIKLFFEKENKVPGSELVKRVIAALKMKGTFSNENRVLRRRMASFESDYFYDLGNRSREAIRINPLKCEIVSNPPTLFIRGQHMKGQDKPDLSAKPKELLNLIRRHFRFKDEQSLLLFTTYVVTCFVPDISRAILVLHGEKGAAKSTTMRYIKEIVDPATQDLLALPSSNQDLAITLSNNYMLCFDNLEKISNEKSNLLCMASTGGAITRRKLYSNDEEVVLQLQRAVALNGINNVATRPDLLDRSLLIELERIPSHERKTEIELSEAFSKDKPAILGGIFQTLSKAMNIRKDLELNQVGRMADFSYWGYAIAEALELDGDKFLQFYFLNQNLANDEAIHAHPVGSAVLLFMNGRSQWSGSVSALLQELQVVAERNHISTSSKLWANEANVLSRRLKEVKSNLLEVGFEFDIRHAGNYRKITITSNRNVHVAPKTKPQKNIADIS